MSQTMNQRQFTVLPGSLVNDVLEGSEPEVMEVVRRVYLDHESGKSVNPDSYFLRFAHKPDARIIALPAYLGSDTSTAGIKWVASFPENVAHGRPRASAILVLNDAETGYPYALLEGAGISAARTAASAALAACALGASSAKTVGIVGAGVIARTICRYLATSGVPLADVSCYDVDDSSVQHLTRYVRDDLGGSGRSARLCDVLDCDVVVFATSALKPYVDPAYVFSAGQIVLNVSLRDIDVPTVLAANNIVDDIEHCLKADTAPHRAEKQVGHREFIDGTIGSLLRGEIELDDDRATIFSPFGLGVLDLGVGTYVHEKTAGDPRVRVISDFFGETSRW